MSKNSDKYNLRRVSWANIIPKDVHDPQAKPSRTTSSAPSSGNAGRREYDLQGSRGTVSLYGTDVDPVHTMQRNCINWQLMSQHLTLLLEQRRRSQLVARRSTVMLSTEERNSIIKRATDQTPQMSRRITGENMPYDSFTTADDVLDLDDEPVEDASLFKVDAHIIPLNNLVERFNSNLTTGLTSDTVEQHRVKFGQNKLTPSRPPSLLWMFIKELLIGFNFALWIATLFAFLSYVSLEYAIVNALVFF